jgi:hypothetical protein
MARPTEQEPKTSNGPAVIIDVNKFLKGKRELEVRQLTPSYPNLMFLKWLPSLDTETGLVFQDPNWYVIKGSKRGIPSHMMPEGSDALVHVHVVDKSDREKDVHFPSLRDFRNCSATARNFIVSPQGITQYWPIDDPYDKETVEIAIEKNKDGDMSGEEYADFLQSVHAKYKLYKWENLTGSRIKALFENSPLEKGRNIELSRFWQARLGGTFEAGGGCYYSIDNTRRRVIAHVDLSDTDPELSRRLRVEFGGLITREGKTNRWVLSGLDAASFIAAISSFIPSRKKIVALAKEAEQTIDFEEQVAMINRFREEGAKKRDVSVEDYMPLLEIPEFVAGVMDARGVLRTCIPQNTPETRLHVLTANESLLKALEARFGGGIYTYHNEGEETEIKGKKYILTRDSKVWILGEKETIDLCRWIAPYLTADKIKKHPFLEGIVN